MKQFLADVAFKLLRVGFLPAIALWYAFYGDTLPLPPWLVSAIAISWYIAGIVVGRTWIEPRSISLF